MKSYILTGVVALMLLTGCSATANLGQQANGSSGIKSAITEPQTGTIFAMDTVMDITAYSDNTSLIEQAEDLILSLENELSVTKQDSEISKLNKTGNVNLSDDAAELLNNALSFCNRTDGALDISIYPIVRAWGFTTDAYRIPSEEERSTLLQKVDYSAVQLQGTEASLPEGMEIDLGSVTKGFTGDKLETLLRENGTESALINLGGNIQVIGCKPDGSKWRIAVQNPEKTDYLGVLSISNQAVITSGGYERYFVGEDGTVYWHIIDPATGAPARSGLISATIIGEQGVYCDALSTALFVKGLDGAIDYWQENRDFEAIFVTDKDEIYVTDGIADSFSLADAYQDWPLTVITDQT